MGKFNLHTHTFRCNHASGEDEEFVLKAIENGYETIGFSDHVPYIFDIKTHYSTFRMRPELTQDYVDSINSLKEKYKDKIDILLGYEVEWYPRLIENELKFLKSFGYDYLILGQHYTGNETESWAKYTGHKTRSVKTLDRFIEQVIDAAKSGEFAYVAHPDIINFRGSKKLYIEKMEEYVKTLKEIDIPLECNFLGYTDKRFYPNRAFWELVAKYGNRVVIGLDAHRPDVYDDEENLDKLKQKLAELGITPIEDVNEILSFSAKKN